MNTKQKAEYILAYYWYHILITAVLLVIVCIVVYHLIWGNQKKVFSLAIINQEIDYERDNKLLEQFAESSGISSKKLLFDSDYLLSYQNVELEGINESSFDKFFLGWLVGSTDAAVMPVSFYQYCKEQNGEFIDIEKIYPEVLLKDNENINIEGKYLRNSIHILYL